MVDIVYRPDQEASLYMWDENKAIANWKKHKVTFETAVRVFSDKNAVVLPDIGHSDFEQRKRIIGTVLDVISHVRILFVVYVKRVDTEEGLVTRIISARDANKEEARIYERNLSR